MKKIYSYFLWVALMLCGTVGFAQTKNFKLVQDLDVQYNILRSLADGFVDSIDFKKVIDTGIEAMLESLDPYTEYIPEEENEALDVLTTATYGGIGAIIKKIDTLGVQIVQPSKGTPAVKYGLEPGDIILAIDGADTKPLTADECSKRMKGEAGSRVKFLVRKGRTGLEKEIEVTREEIHTSDVSYYGMLKNDTTAVKYGYIKVDAFTLNGAEDVRKAVVELKRQGADRLIIDLRGNGGGLMDEATNIVSIFVPKGTLVATAKGRSESANFKCITSQEPADTLTPLMVLVNSGSASSSEIVAGALQDLDRATIIGTRTYGKGLVQSFAPVGYNGKLKLTISKYYTPSGRCIQIMDYSHRNADGSVGAIPDSLKKAFKTKKGRTVYDGGGIAPDIEIKGKILPREIYSIYASGILEDWAIEYYKNHKSIVAPEKFRLTDKEYGAFIKYATLRRFDSRSMASIAYEKVLSSAKEMGQYEADKEAFDKMEKLLNPTKEQMLLSQKEEIKILLEQIIVQKYYYTFGMSACMLRSDAQLTRSVSAWKDYLYSK